MKVVINRCWGGFSLSPKAVKRLAELQGRQCYFYTNPRTPLDIHRLVPITVDEASASFMWFAYDIPDAHLRDWSPKNWHELSQEQRIRINEEADSHSIERLRNIERHDPNLVKVVEELREAANGSHAELSVIEIPDGIEYEIDEYDGMESVHEVHRSWR